MWKTNRIILRKMMLKMLGYVYREFIPSYEDGKLYILTGIATFMYAFSDTIWKYIFYRPGIGKITTRKNKKTRKQELLVDSPMGMLRIPTLEGPKYNSIDISLFKKPVVEKTEIITREQFKEKYYAFENKIIEKHGSHMILQTVHTNQTKEKKISGWIRSLEHFKIFVFTVENDYIDYEKLVTQFLTLLERDEVCLDIDV